MTKHKAEAELEFACSVCERRFEKAHNLNVHMSMVHPLLQEHNTHTADMSWELYSLNTHTHSYHLYSVLVFNIHIVTWITLAVLQSRVPR